MKSKLSPRSGLGAVRAKKSMATASTTTSAKRSASSLQYGWSPRASGITTTPALVGLAARAPWAMTRVPSDDVRWKSRALVEPPRARPVLDEATEDAAPCQATHQPWNGKVSVGGRDARYRA